MIRLTRFHQLLQCNTMIQISCTISNSINNSNNSSTIPFNWPRHLRPSASSMEGHHLIHCCSISTDRHILRSSTGATIDSRLRSSHLDPGKHHRSRSTADSTLTLEDYKEIPAIQWPTLAAQTATQFTVMILIALMCSTNNDQRFSKDHEGTWTE